MNPTVVFAVVILICEPSISAHRNYTKFCDENAGPCQEMFDNGDIQAANYNKERLKYDNETAFQLLGELKYYLNLTKYENLTEHDQKDANFDVDKIASLVQDIANVATKPMWQEEVQSAVGASAASTSNSLFFENVIAEKMKEDPRVDVSILGNSAKETGHQMGKMAVKLSEGHDDSLIFETTMAQDYKEIDNPTQSTSIHPSYFEATVDINNKVWSNASSERNSGSREDVPYEKIDLSSLYGAMGSNEVWPDNEHEQNKQNMLKLIRTLNITGKTEEDLKRIEEIVKQVEAIDKEHHQRMMLLKQRFRGNFHHGRGNWRKNGRRRYPHHFKKHHLHPIDTNNEFQQSRESPAQMQHQGYSEYSTAPPENWRVLLNEETVTISPEKVNQVTLNPEVNFNGGYEESIDELKRKFTNGRWPEVVNSGFSNVGQKLQKVVVQYPELGPKSQSSVNEVSQQSTFDEQNRGSRGRPLPINILFNDYYESDSDRDGDGESMKSLNQKAENHVGIIAKREEPRNSYNDYEQEGWGPEYLEDIIRSEKSNTAMGRKSGHHVQEHEANPKMPDIKPNFIRSFRKKQRK